MPGSPHPKDLHVREVITDHTIDDKRQYDQSWGEFTESYMGRRQGSADTSRQMPQIGPYDLPETPPEQELQVEIITQMTGTEPVNPYAFSGQLREGTVDPYQEGLEDGVVSTGSSEGDDY